MAKRKRDNAAAPSARPAPFPPSKPSLLPPTPLPADPEAIHLQVITGTYEKTIHGFIVSLPSVAPSQPDTSALSLPATFADTFLFTAHTAPIRALAISPASTNSSTKRILATSSADERINLYHLSSAIPKTRALTALSSKNKNLGALHHHLNTPTALLFTPNRSKLLSAGADGQINILRTRDWQVLSTLKAPKPKPKPIDHTKDYGGDGYGPRIETLGTEGAYGGGAGGINDIALHPSQKLLLSVGARERGVRQWNMMTGHKAGVLAFSRDVLPARFGNEGLHVEWSMTGREYAVMFDRGVLVLGVDDAKPKCKIAPGPKLHMMRYIVLPKKVAGLEGEGEEEVLVLATEDGRILFYSTATETPVLHGVLGGRSLGMPTRIKDFEILKINEQWIVITGCSDGVVRIWDLCGEGSGSGIEISKQEEEAKSEKQAKTAAATPEERQLGKIIGIYETGERVTCLAAMTMEVGDEAEEEDVEMEDKEDDSSDDSDDE